ncbi:unnamed protein product, partial [Phaeothamnion confervicola]
MRSITLFALVFLAASGAAYAQVSPTEQFVPIGQTPAESVMQGEVVSGVQTQFVQPQSVGAPPTTPFTMKTGGIDRVYLINPMTRIYIDRSQQGDHSELGTVADLRPGRTVEAYVPDLGTRLALW